MLTDKDVLTGLLFIAIGAFFAIGAQDYAMGTMRRMGPGYFPVVLGSLLVIIGTVLAIKSVVRRLPEPIDRLHIRPVLGLTAAILVFAALVERAGLVAACIACVVVAGIASSETRWREAALIAVGMAAFSALVFKALLGLPFRLWVF
ncbi:tripartite tricarboxylate transporter TctB family protein [Paralimibaculum aggregatum]|nr:tripartite tricarboxylate transporter TctB family protein [Limibaculum sp. NKW23]